MNDEEREELEQDSTYRQADETQRGYLEAEVDHSQPQLPRPAASHIELTGDGHIVKAKDLEALTFNREHNAPELSALDAETAEHFAEEQSLPSAPAPEHLEVQIEDESVEEELQDGALSEEELIDMAPAAELFDDPEEADDADDDDDDA